MAHIHYVECNRSHTNSFEIDVPVGHHWLLIIAKTPAQYWVNGKLIEYPAHSAVLYRPQQKVYYKACTDQFINDWIRFESNEPYITESPLPFGIPFSVNDPEYCQKLFELLVIEHNYNHSYKTSSIDYLLRTLFNKLMESHNHAEITPQYYNLLRLRNAIHSDPSDEWTVARMAECLNISPGYLQSMYKKAFSISCMEDVIHSRIRLAKEYLSHSSEGISDIAARCGYKNVEHFCRQFKKLTGSTPKHFQKHAKL